jgi:hypothetical protein
MRVRRAYEGGVGLAGQIHVVAEAACAGEKAGVFLAAHGLADAVGRGLRP